MRTLLIVVTLLFVANPAYALTEAQRENIEANITALNEQVNIIIDAREDVNALLRMDAPISDDTLILNQVNRAKQRAAVAANELNALLQ